MDLITSGHIVKPIQIDQKGRLKSYYDTKKVAKGDTQLHFFPPQVTRRDTTRNNYVGNPIPGSEVRKVLSIGVKISKTIFVTHKDGTNTIVDPVKIVNALTFGSLKLTLNSDNVQVLEAPLHKFLAQGDTQIAVQADGNKQFVTIASKGLVRLNDPFQIGENQVFDAVVNFADAQQFPTESEWATAGQEPLEIQVELLMSEEPSTRQR